MTDIHQNNADWCSKVFSATTGALFKSHTSLTDTALNSVLSKALEWIKSSNIADFKISHCVTEIGGYNIFVTLIVFYRQHLDGNTSTFNLLDIEKIT